MEQDTRFDIWDKFVVGRRSSALGLLAASPINPNNVIQHNCFSPVAVGALGGSGTRVIGQLMMDCGIYIGDNLNGPNDNLTFTCLFKRPELYGRGETEIREHLRTFEKHMSGQGWDPIDYKRYRQAFYNNPHCSKRPLSLYKELFEIWWKNKFSNDRPERWGWKEPNTQVFLEHIANYFEDISYIHVVRHGLDMAYSNNRQQLGLWSHLHEIIVPEEEPEIFVAQLEYWIKANKRSIDIGKRALGDRFYQLNYEAMCNSPERVIPELLSFLRIQVSPDKLEELIRLPRPTTQGRYRSRDNSIFPEWMIDEVRQLGFEIEV